VPVIYPSSDVIDNVYTLRNIRLGYSVIKCTSLLFIHFTESRIWVPIPICTKEVSPFPSLVIRSSVSQEGICHIITGETRVQYQASICQICGGQIDTDTGTSPRNSVFPCHCHSINDTARSIMDQQFSVPINNARSASERQYIKMQVAITDAFDVFSHYRL